MAQFSVSKHVFFEDVAPPPPLAFLTADIDIRFNRLDAEFSLVAYEELRPKDRHDGGPVRTVKTIRRDPNPPYVPRPHASTTMRAPPLPAPSMATTAPSATAPSFTRTTPESNLPASPNDDSVPAVLRRGAGEPQRKIPKPNGEPGRSGFNIEDQVGWDSTKYNMMKNRIHEIVDATFDTEKGIRGQDKGALGILVARARDEFPAIDRFEDAWPVVAIVKMHLKYTSEQERKRKQQIREGKQVERAAKNKARQAINGLVAEEESLSSVE